MSLFNVPFEELRTECRQKLETCEIWLRRLIEEQLSRKYGVDYFDALDLNGQNLIRKEIREHADTMMKGNPGRYSKKVDTLFFEYLVDILCKQELYDQFFSTSLQHIFPNSRQEARFYLSRLIPIRNKLSHANPISMHEAERVLCYCDDVINGLKEFYKAQKMDQEYNAPQFTRFSDSQGHSEILKASQNNLNFTKGSTLRPGDTIRCEWEVDASFDADSYVVEWTLCNMIAFENEKGTGLNFSFPLLPRHVGEELSFQIVLRSKKDWHRHQGFDSRLVVSYKVLPPIN